MAEQAKPRIAILYPGDYEARQTANIENNRFANLFRSLAELGAHAEPAVYHPDFWQEVQQQISQVEAVLVWVNPIQQGHDRTILDKILRDIANQGIFVSTHPDIILKMGTKEVLYQTRLMGWGCDTQLYANLEQLRRDLPRSLASRQARVLKQYRGNDGIGVWKVEINNKGLATHEDLPLDTVIKVRHAQRGSVDQLMTLSDVFQLCEQYFIGSGKVIDQPYQSRLPEGMIRCYLTQNRVVGFGHQAINALYPTDERSGEVMQPGPRLYHPPSMPEFQPLKQKLEQEWVSELQQILDVSTDQLPIIWDADFLLGTKDQAGNDTYVLCEINVSSVAPYPESAVLPMAQAAIAQAQAR
jgi:hypothetical protein